MFSVSPLLSLGRVDNAWVQLAAGENSLDEYDHFGKLAWHAGRASKARKLWSKGLAAAQTYDMPWDTGRLHVEIARHAEAGSAERTEHEAAARAILEPMGAVGTLRLLG